MWVAEGWIAGQNGKAVKLQVTEAEELDEKALEKFRQHVTVAYYLRYRVWPTHSQQVATKVYQR